MELNQKVIDCSKEDCAYNRNRLCHARAIMIGADHPKCDTYINGWDGGMDQFVGMVGSCKVKKCRYNQRLECTTEGINVGLHEGHPDCITFQKK